MSSSTPLSMRPLGQNNSQQPQSHLTVPAGKLVTAVKKKVTATADSSGLGVENDTPVLIKHHHSVKKFQTPSVTKRNQRERNRVRGVNDGFGKLKLHVPDLKNKSSKVETLRGAIDYIRNLKSLLGEEIVLGPSPSFKFEEDMDGKIYKSELPIARTF